MLILLLTPLPPAPTLKAADLSALVAAATPVPALPPAGAPSPAPAKDGDARAVRLLLPNADGVADLVAASQEDAQARLPNPFRTRWRPASAIREAPVVISSVLIGENPAEASAVINGCVYSRGDTLEGLAITAITAEAIELRAGTLCARLPVQETPLVLRLPR